MTRVVRWEVNVRRLPEGVVEGYDLDAANGGLENGTVAANGTASVGVGVWYERGNGVGRILEFQGDGEFWETGSM